MALVGRKLRGCHLARAGEVTAACGILISEGGMLLPHGFQAVLARRGLCKDADHGRKSTLITALVSHEGQDIDRF